jgi:two-component system response regulator AtoC
LAQILIIEDEVLLAKSLARSLTGKGHDCITVTNAEEGIGLLEKMPTDIVLIDLQLPGMSGFEAMKLIRKQEPETSVIVITAFGTMASAVEAMRSGASDFLRKPIDTEELALAVDRAVANAKLKHTVSYYQSKEAEKTTKDFLICDSPGMKRASEVIDKVINMNLPLASDYPPVLILGETGTGKDLVARYIHFNSRLSDHPFVEVNCSSLPRGLEEAELFGYDKGAFTGAQKSKRGLFEAADGGAIFLNEIGDLNPEAQVKILKAIEDKIIRHVGGLRDLTINVRVLAATNRDLKNREYFREDLYHRLNHLRIDLPALRERTEDILPLARMFLKKFCRKYNVEKRLSREAEEALVAYHWSGNVRELNQCIERAIFLSTNSEINAEDLGLPYHKKSSLKVENAGGLKIEFPAQGISLDKVEKEIILEALKAATGNVSKAARSLQIGREALRYRIKKYSISKEIKLS